MNRREFCQSVGAQAAALVALESSSGFCARPLGMLLQGDAAGAAIAEFSLKNPIDHPFYLWPRTLLTWQIDDLKASQQANLVLRCVETKYSIPFQLTDTTDSAQGSKPACKIRFFSDLPAGEQRTFRLEEAKSAAIASFAFPRIKVKVDEEGIIVDQGPMQIRIAGSQMVSGTAPGPILQICRGGKWVGKSTLSITGYRIREIVTECIESGPLSVIYRLTYKIEGGSEYIAEIECAAGMDFVRVREDMLKLPEEIEGAWEFVWSGCSFTNRQMPDHPYPFPPNVTTGHSYEDYGWERVDATVMNTHIGLARGMDNDGLMAYSIDVYQPWPVWTKGSYISFWNKDSGDATALFIDRAALWNDPDYPIWHCSGRMSIQFICRKDATVWRWPVARGTRSIGISFYSHQKDIDHMEALEKLNLSGIDYHDGKKYGTGLFPTSHGHYLQNRYGTIDLDRVKNWVLTYDDTEPQGEFTFKNNSIKTPSELEYNHRSSYMTTQLPLSGTRQNSGYAPVPERSIIDSYVPAYCTYRSNMTAEQRRRCTAFFLMNAYMSVDEDYMPMVSMLSGHPNFLSDVRSVPAAISTLFPHHPDAGAWLAIFEKYLDLNTHYHTRPDVKQWGAKGGRWTENIGTYVWGFLRPVVRAHYMLRQSHRENLVCNEGLAKVGDWLVNTLSAPFNGESRAFLENNREEIRKEVHYWGLVRPENGPCRVHPPIGAHSERRRPPSMMWYLGTMLMQYAPLTAEHLMWASRPSNQDEEEKTDMPNPWHVLYRQPDNRGTNPHLRSSKYTGYGITLRAAVDTPQEISIHLQQIDDGPNYRWGVSGEGGCGLVYYYAGGKGYSHNSGEDQGDRDASDTDFVTNFGVWKDGYFRSIGQNVLSRPFYDLNVAQFAEIVPRSGANSYCTPEYVSRSILLVGAEYFLLCDRVFNESIAHRLSWFVRKGDDFPHIVKLRGAHPSGTGATFPTTQIDAGQTVGKWFDGTGSSMALVTHLDGVKSTSTPFGARISTPESEDWIFFDQAGVRFEEQETVFRGVTGVVRRRDSTVELALIHGELIGTNEYRFKVSNVDIGIYARIEAGKSLVGQIVAPVVGDIEITLPVGATGKKLYLNGTQTEGATGKNILHVHLSAGTYEWELTEGLPRPMPPQIVRTENASRAARVLGKPVNGATGYRLELSEDDEVTWRNAMAHDKPDFTLTGLDNGKKYHARMIALNAERESDLGPSYPIYVTEHAPLPPCGLRVQLDTGVAHLTWGEVLGATEYRLYKKRSGEGRFTKFYSGLDRSYIEIDPAIRKADRTPGQTMDKGGKTIEYYVTAVNGNGEGNQSMTVDTNPSSWRNWIPIPNEPFRRGIIASEYGRKHGMAPNDGTGFYYPE